MSDPEGYVVEIHVDRDRSHRNMKGELIKIDTIALDKQAVRMAASHI